jgi:hypothetical protein
MGLYAASYIASTLESLNAAGIAIVLEGERWFIKSDQQIAGPYATPEAALEASMGWLSASVTRHVGENAGKDYD